jgi:hypothetical protein
MSSVTHPKRSYRCACGHEHQIFESGRRVYLEPTDGAPADPVMSGLCPDCGCLLPGKRAV